MIVGNYARCTGCNHEYRIRYNLGGNFPQSASFFCISCKQSITYGYGANRELVVDNIEIIENSLNPQVVNLHPEIPIDEARQFDAKYFPSVEFLSKAKTISEIVSFRNAQASNVDYLKEWDSIQEDYRRLMEQLWSLLIPKYGSNNANTTDIILQKVVHVASVFLQGKWKTLLDNVLKEVADTKSHANFAALKMYLLDFKEDFLLHKMFDLMTQYRSVETELLSTLLSQKQGYQSKGLSSSAKWDKIERVYGDFYETFGELALVPATINNLLVRNNYQQFATPGFSLEDYLATDKAKRCANFVGNPHLQPLGEFYDASLRNGTHHKTARINKAKQKIVLKIGKGGKSEKVWSFVEYIEYCNELYARCLIVLIAFNDIIS